MLAGRVLGRRRPRLPPRCAVVTGASRGIGAAFTRALPGTTNIILVARDEGKLAEAAGRLAGTERRIETVAADLATSEGRRLVSEAAGDLEADLLVNCAGLGTFGPFVENDPDRELETLEVNIVALTELCRRVLPGMLGRARRLGERAGLINVSSTTAFVPVPRLAVYAASKAYVLSLTEALAAELAGAPVDVLALCPGATRTDFAQRAGWGESFPFARSPDHVARVALGALGQRRVVFTDAASEAALRPLASLRAATAGGIRSGLTLWQAGRRLDPRP
jgi:short-subunit dehydrogenase